MVGARADQGWVGQGKGRNYSNYIFYSFPLTIPIEVVIIFIIIAVLFSYYYEQYQQFYLCLQKFHLDRFHTRSSIFHHTFVSILEDILWNTVK